MVLLLHFPMDGTITRSKVRVPGLMVLQPRRVLAFNSVVEWSFDHIVLKSGKYFEKYYYLVLHPLFISILINLNSKVNYLIGTFLKT